MLYWTYAQIKAKVKEDLKLNDESFVTPTEMLGYANEAISECAFMIHGINEDYFLTPTATFTLTTGVSEYDLPTNIYAQKIREIIYQNGATFYEISQIRGEKRFMTAQDIALNGTSEDYRYLLINRSASEGVKLKLYPASRETSTTNVTLWYIRNANRLIADADLCDIPEWVPFVIQYMKCRCYENEGNPKLGGAVGKLEQIRSFVMDSLKERVVDDDNTVPIDTSFYHDFTGGTGEF